MGNYKPYGHSAIDIGGVITPCKPKVIYAFITGTTATSMHEAKTYTDYVVPTGKKFVAKGINVLTIAAAGFITWYEDATANAGSGTILGYTHTNLVANQYYFPTEMEFAAGKYITAKCDIALIRHVYLIGYEESI